MSPSAGLPPTLVRLVTATNNHDLDGLVGCFADDYRLVMPNHPARNFTGPGQVRRNWDQFFTLIPDITVEVTAAAAGPADQWWTEWEIRGTRLDGSPHHMRGVMVMTVGEDDLIHANRFYVEPVEASEAGIDDAVATLTRAGG